MADKDPLTHKQRLFVEFYLGRANGNATEAAKLAGHPARSAYSVGWENLRKPEIATEISRRVQEAAMEADEVLARLADIARGSLANFIDVTEAGSWRPNLKKGEEAGKLHLLAEVGFTEHGPKFKIHDPVGALTQLGRHHKLFTDRQEHGGKVTFDIEEQAAEYDRRLAERAARYQAGEAPGEQSGSEGVEGE